MVCHVILRCHQGPGSVFIQAVDDAWPKLTPDAFEVPTMVEQGIHQGPAAVSWRGMNHKAGRFIHHDEIGVFVKDRQGNGLGLAGEGLRRWDFRPDKVPAPCDIAGFLC